MKIISKNKDFYDYLVGLYGEDEKLVYDRRLNFYQNPTIACPKLKGFEIEYPHKKYAWHSLLWVGDELVHIFVTNTNEVFTSFDVENIEKLFGKYIDFWDGAELTLKNGETIQFFSQFGENEIFLHHNLLKQQGFLPRKKSPIFNVIFQEFITTNYLKHHHYSLFRENITIETVPILLIYSSIESYKDYMKMTANFTHRYSARSNHKTQVLLDGKMTEIYRPYFRIFVNPNLQSLGVFFDPVFVWQNISEYLGRLRTEREISPPVADEDKIVNKGFDIKHSFRPKMKK